MPQPTQLPPETVAYLRDEAYLHLCRQSLSQESIRLAAEKTAVGSARPPFAILASKKKRLAYEAALAEVVEGEAAIQQKLVSTERLEHLLQSKLHGALNDYLGLNDPDHRIFNQICDRVDQWQNAVAGLGEHALAFARDTRTAAQGGPELAPAPHTVPVLRAAAAYLHAAAAKIERIADEAEGLGEGRLPRGTRLPALPPFRAAIWVDKTLLLPPAKRAAELQAAEAEARAFCTGGKNDLLIAAEKVRAASLHAREASLDEYWRGLRAHALAHYVKPREVDETIAELTERYLVGDLEHHQRERVKNPFGI